jgi:hypothetical protein
MDRTAEMVKRRESCGAEIRGSWLNRQHACTLRCSSLSLCRSLAQHDIQPSADAKPMSEEDRKFLKNVCQ